MIWIPDDSLFQLCETILPDPMYPQYEWMRMTVIITWPTKKKKHYISHFDFLFAAYLFWIFQLWFMSVCCLLFCCFYWINLMIRCRCLLFFLVNRSRFILASSLEKNPFCWYERKKMFWRHDQQTMDNNKKIFFSFVQIKNYDHTRYDVEM